jgi:tRNA pseudouridine55 synthase
VAVVRRLSRIKQVGHGGTLDPLATGVLPVAVGKSCRLLRFLPGRKVYRAEIRLGQRTTTDDIEGETIGETAAPAALPDEAAVIGVLDRFRGRITQVPPLYSAIHVGGKRLYELARAGQAVAEIPERTVEVFSLEVISFASPVLTVRIACSEGTYIRSIARDAGEALGCGACLQALVREQAGPFELAQAYTLAQLQEAADSGRLAQLLVPPQTVLTLAQVELNEEQVSKLKMGQSLVLQSGAADGLPAAAADQPVLAISGQTLVAVCRQSADSADQGCLRLSPEVVVI